MAETVTIYRCSTYGALETEEGCTVSPTGRTWRRLDNNGTWSRRFSAGLGWTESRLEAARKCFSFWSQKHALAQRQAKVAAASMDDYRAMMEQEQDNG